MPNSFVRQSACFFVGPHITFYILTLWYLLVVTLDLLAWKHILLPERAFVQIVVVVPLFCKRSNVLFFSFQFFAPCFFKEKVASWDVISALSVCDVLRIDGVWSFLLRCAGVAEIFFAFLSICCPLHQTNATILFRFSLSHSNKLAYMDVNTRNKLMPSYTFCSLFYYNDKLSSVCSLNAGRVFAVGVAIRFHWWRDFPHPSRPTRGIPSLLYNGNGVSFPGVNGPGNDVIFIMTILRIIVMDSEMRPAHHDQLNFAFPKPP